MHIVMFGACLIYLYRVEVLPGKCVNFQSTCFWVSCGDIVEISLHGVWVWVWHSLPSLGFLPKLTIS